jgi:hypothetical protein
MNRTADSAATPEGVEIASFRLKAGVSEDRMVIAHERMVTDFLATQEGWRGHELLTTGEGYVLIARAIDEDRAREICHSWLESEVCGAFLALIEAGDMTFGSRITP